MEEKEEVYHLLIKVKIIFKMIFYPEGCRAISKRLPARELVVAELILGFDVFFNQLLLRRVGTMYNI
jgi:hypothetical protein